MGDRQRLLGAPAINALEFARQNVYFKRLPDMAADIKKLKKIVEELKSKKD